MGYYVELERQKLQFEMRKFEAQQLAQEKANELNIREIEAQHELKLREIESQERLKQDKLRLEEEN